MAAVEDAAGAGVTPVLDALPHIVWTAGPGGQVAFYNRWFYRYAGLEREQVLGTGWHSVVHPDDLPGVLELRSRSIASGQPWEIEYRLRRADGAYRWHLARAVPIFSPDNNSGEIVQWVGTATDIHERHENADALAAVHARQQHVAVQIQQSLLLVPPPDAYPGVTIKTLYRSSHDDALVGGDFFDVFAVSEDVVALVVGDATGKGVEAATYTAEIKFALRAFLREHRDLAEALRLLNQFIVDNDRLDAAHIGNSYIALSAVLVDTRTGYIRCASGGAEPPLLVSPGAPEDSGGIIELSAGGMLLGVAPDATYNVRDAMMGEDDMLAISTDGLTEARRGRGVATAFFGLEGIARTVREETGPAHRVVVGGAIPSLTEVGEAVVARAREWAGGVQQDDICLVLMRRRRPSAGAASPTESEK